MQGLRKTLEYIEEVKLKEYVGIPFQLGGFDEVFPYIEKNRQILLFAATGTGKTQFAIKKFVIDPILFAMRTGYKLHITYAAVEMREVDIMSQIMSYLYFLEYGVKYPKEKFIRDKPDDDIMRNLYMLQEKYQAFNTMLDVIEDVKNPTGLYKLAIQKCMNNGKLVPKADGYGTDYINESGVHQIRITDTINSMKVEKEQNRTSNIDKYSGEYCKELTDKFGNTEIIIQQADKSSEQNQFTFGGKKVEYNTLPARGALAYSKHTPDDANIVMNLYNPFLYGIPNYPFDGKPEDKYDIQNDWKGHFTRLSVEKNRDGKAPAECGMYFDGMISDFRHLPPAVEFKRNPNLIKEYIR